MRVLDLKPLAIDLYCGLGGWAEGFLAEGFDVIGFDIERHDYGTGGYPGQLVIQDALTLHGSQFKDAAMIVASPPCQAYSYRAMPWKKAKALPPPDNTLFEACFRIQREACEAAGHHIPLIVENVRGAQPWVGRSNWHFGSFHLWGDIPALMPIPYRGSKNDGGSWFAVAPHNKERGQNPDGRKVSGLDWSRFGKPGYKAQGFNVTAAQRYREDGVKQSGSGREWFAGEGKISRLTSSRSDSRKAASAQIAKIPFPLARHIAKCFYPPEQRPLHREAAK